MTDYNHNNTVGIIGGGIVGGAIKNFFPEAKVYDKYKPSDPITEAASAKFIFICVPTPYNNGFDLSIMDDAIENAARNLIDPENQLVVIKSTALPGTTQKYQDKYPEINFAFNPEFLRDKTANQDFVKADRQIVGYTTKTENHPLINELMEFLPRAPFEKIMPSGEAEMIKYAANTFLALRVIFANQIYDLANVVGINYDDVKDAVKADKRIGKSHWEILHTEESLVNNISKPYRGYGGKCFPKDVNSLVYLGRALGVDVSLFESAAAVNFKLNGGKYEK